MKVIKKAVIMIVAVALVIGVVAAISISAEQELPTLSIDKFNLSLKDSIYLKYAVTAKNASDVKLLIWTAPQDEYVLGTQNETLTSTGTSGGMLVFDYTKLTAKRMTDVVYARAYTEVEDVVYYSDVRSYSILEYIYTKLGYIGDSATTDAKLITLLEKMLEYGAAAQDYQGYNLNRLATDTYYQVTVEGGTLADGTTSGLYKAGDSITLTAPATNSAGEKFSHWQDSTGAVVTATPEVGSNNETYTAIYRANEPDPDPEPDPEITEPTIIVSSTAALVGDTGVEVTVALKNNPGVTSLRMKIDFDDTALNLEGMTYNTAIGGMGIPLQSTASPVIAYWADGFKDVTGDWTFVTLKFNVSNTAIASDYDITVTYTADDIYNAEETNIDFDISNGKITVS